MGWETSTALIKSRCLDSTFKFGTGFAISRTWLLTSRHIVETDLQSPEVIVRWQHSKEKCYLRGDENNGFLRAEEVILHSSLDAALVKIPMPADLEYLSIETQVHEAGEFDSEGYPSGANLYGEPSHIRVSGYAQTMDGSNDRFQVTMDLHPLRVTDWAGLSGGAIVLRSSGKAIGLLQETREIMGQSRTAWAVPISSLMNDRRFADILEKGDYRSRGANQKRGGGANRSSIGSYTNAVHRVGNWLLDSAGNDARPRLERIVNNALAALSSGEAPGNRLHAQHIFRLQLETLSALQKGLLTVADEIAEVDSALGELGLAIKKKSVVEFASVEIRLTDDLINDFKSVQSLLFALDGGLGTGLPQNLDGNAFEAVQFLHEILGEAIDVKAVNIGLLSMSTENARDALKEEFEKGFRQIARGIGRHVNSSMRGAVFLDHDFAPQMIVIPKDQSFEMGTPDTVPAAEHSTPEAAASPQHRVTITKPVAIARYLVSWSEFDRYCSETGRHPLPKGNWTEQRFPAVNLTWHDATEYCSWLSDLSGADYRLPTEAEWEYACRSGTMTDFAFGRELPDDWEGVFDNEADLQGRPVFVDSPKGQSNSFGLFQMHGNVWEWCADDFVHGYHDHPGQLPRDLGESWPHKVIRGGSWNDEARMMRSWYRQATDRTTRSPILGFRVARFLP